MNKPAREEVWLRCWAVEQAIRCTPDSASYTPHQNTITSYAQAFLDFVDPPEPAQ